jgi:predicted helicase
LFGKREIKYDFLFDNTLKDIKWNELIPNEPDLLFIPQDFEIQTKYKVGFSLKDLFLKSSVGVQTHRDELVIDFSKENLNNRLKELFTTDNLKSFAIKYEVTESNSWSLDIAIKKEVALKNEIFRKITYRPFDERSIYYSDNFVDRTRKNVGKEIVKENLVLNFPKIVKVDWCHSLITKSIPTAISMDINGTYFAPLYLYPETNGQQTIGQSTERTPNLNATIVKQIADKLGLTFTNEKETTENTFAPIDLLDYIYAVLHSPIYREKYKEFLKIDFPRVPYPKDKDTFGQLVKLGGQIRQIHLLESPIVEQYITQYPIDGNNVVVKPHYENSPPLEGCPQDGVVLGKVYINDTQYFANVPQIAWEFYIGGYQPAQKWLKDRKGRTLEFDDILHYQKIIVALTETDRLMKEIDTIAIE